ncbi:mucoidy inhibitor MuiA family protein [Cyclobacterium qasimii]|uniref:TonB-dependent receptor n=1 Tax=Cyclobacterium qasimii M12-11B TaxID=641524 RepID=S7VAX0_9BACT|nr:mucoidy inhibitor MuiA family protein [Cyclobacterium qasimii]EPR67131.1 TonB-dependent receptor [Cyclobacterium qasimii M12-11B]
MKALSVLLFFLIFNQSFTQEIPEKEVKSKVVEATVFLKGAQVLRKETVVLPKGESIVKFTNLSPFIAAKSIQLKAGGELTVLGINHQQNFLDKSVKSEELLKLDKDLEQVNEKIELENAYLSIAQEEITFLQTNRLIGGKNETLNVATLKQAAEYYGDQLTALKLQTIERNNTIKKLLEQKNNLQNQINSLAGEKEFSTGEVLVRVDAKVPGSYSFELSYLVDNAGWFPSYDIRAKDINSPVSLHYKANVRQDTKVDWDNIKLSFLQLSQVSLVLLRN